MGIIKYIKEEMQIVRERIRRLSHHGKYFYTQVFVQL